MQKRECELTEVLAAMSGEYKLLEQQLKQTRESDRQELNGLQSQVQEQKDMLQQEREARIKREERERELTEELSAKSTNNKLLRWELEQNEVSSTRKQGIATTRESSENKPRRKK